ncbi:MAG: hypothetical protein EP332_11510 [Bacteroidetes bacterium]|nr:MAG: hypothetical protein EP332_11510 [Bacteroidota bacterium]
MKLKLTFSILFALLLSSSCRKTDIGNPAYIYIPELKVTTTQAQGSNFIPLPYVNVFINDNSVGVYALPAKFPVLQEGNVKLEVYPMIKRFARDGIVHYAVMQPYGTQIDLKAMETDTLVPEFSYFDNAEFPWLEDFNDNASSLYVKSGTIDTFYIENDLSISRDGTPYMHIDMGTGDSWFEIESQDLFDLPRDGRDIYMELDYRSNAVFAIGLYATSNSGVIAVPSVSPFPTDTAWTKAFIYLSDETINTSSDTRFRVYFRAVNATVDNPHIYLDNIKLVYRKG